jgi:hypothetical protein
MEEIPGEPSQNEGAVDTAIRLINKLKESCVTLQELLVKERAEKKHTLFDLSILGK